MKKDNRKKKILWIGLAVIVLGCAVWGILSAVASYQMSRIPSLTFEDTLAYTTKNNRDAVITVGTIKDGKMTVTVYGKNASVLPTKQHTYEIGSLTKTFTASLLAKAVSEGKVDLNAPVSRYLDLPAKDYYPTLKRLVTHTSGYKEYYLEWPMAANFFSGRNSFYGISPDMLIKRVGGVTLKDRDYPFRYSNFGMAVVGQVLSAVYKTEYPALMNEYIRSDLHLEHTKITDGTGDLTGYWSWKADDAYLAAGGIMSTIGDMMSYLSLQMKEEPTYLARAHESLADVHATPSQYEKMDIRIDAVGIGWMIDTKNGIVWHNGGTSHYNSYAAFDREKQVGVVILSNLAPGYRIPATVMGVKLMKRLQNGN